VPNGTPSSRVHAIVRDPRNDYGEDWLERHHAESHPQDEGGREGVAHIISSLRSVGALIRLFPGRFPMANSS
jgi:hypothetical protein